MIQELKVVEPHRAGVAHDDHILELIPDRGLVDLTSLDLLLLVFLLPLLEDGLHLGHIPLLQLFQVADPFRCFLGGGRRRVALKDAQAGGQRPGDQAEDQEHQPH